MKAILIVEDDRDIRESITEFLECEGYAVKSAVDGAQALELLRGESTLPAVILLDLRMPRMDGFKFREEQRKDSRLARVPVVLMTADAHITSSKDQLGVAAVLRKPIDIEALAVMLQKF